MSPTRHDIVVVGGGIVGVATANLLARCGWSVVLVDGGSAPAPVSGDYGLRVSAVSPGSAAILREAGAGPALDSSRARAYRRMVVEDRGGAARIAFDAPAFGLERLGTIVENDALCHALWAAGVDAHAKGYVTSVVMDADSATVELDDGSRLGAGLVLACDGAGPGLRTLFGIAEEAWEYNQRGLVCTVRGEAPNPGTAWQRFLDTGPLAFLPMADGRSSIVWTLPSAEADRLLALPEPEFIDALGAVAGDWLGGVTAIGERAAFPLTMRISERLVAGRGVLLGDAAHVVHPLAGQGVNLGLADAGALVETLLENRARGRSLADVRALEHWGRWRRSESRVMALGIHGLGALFRPAALAPVRRLGLALTGRSWMARDFFVRRAAGLGPGAPRLARGTSLQSLNQGQFK